MAWKRRIAHDIADLTEGGFTVVPDSGEEISLDCFRVVLDGPKETPYEGGRWHIRFTVSTTFPFTSPSVGFVQHILHPNVDWASGSVCLDALNKKWSPIFTLRHIVETLLPYLLAYPNADDPLNREAAAMMRDHAEAYAAKVVETTKKFGVIELNK